MNSVPDFFMRYELPFDADQRSIKRAYAKALKSIDQETQAQQFQDLRELYELALAWIPYRDWLKSQGEFKQENTQDNEQENSIEINFSEIIQALPQNESLSEETTSIQAPILIRKSDEMSLIDQSDDIKSCKSKTTKEESHRQIVLEFITPTTLASEVFAELIKAYSQSKKGQEVNLLKASLNDERLIDLEARELFEWHVIRHITRGWDQVNGDLFHAAVMIFEWDKDSRRLQGLAEPGQIIDRALTEYSFFQENNPARQKMLLELIEQLRVSKVPKNSISKQDIRELLSLSEQYPTYLHLNTNTQNIADCLTWEEPLDQAKSAPDFREKPAYSFAHMKQRYTSVSYADFVNNYLNLKFLNNLVNSKSGAKQTRNRGNFYGLLSFLISLIFIVSLDTKNNNPKVSAIENSLIQQSQQEDLYQQALLYLSGSNKVEKNILKAIQILDSNSSLGHTKSTYKLGELYLEGEHIPKDLNKGKILLEHASMNGLIQAQISLAAHFHSGQYFEKNLLAAHHWYLTAATGGDQHAQDHVAWMYYDGIGIQNSVKEAMHWWEQASKNGLHSASSILAFHYIKGIQGVEIDEKRGYELIKNAAQNKDPLALILMGDIFKYGLAGVHQNTKHSDELYASAKMEIVTQKTSTKHLCDITKYKEFCRP